MNDDLVLLYSHCFNVILDIFASMYLLNGFSSKACECLASRQSTSLARAMLCGQKYVVGCEIFDMESNGVRKTDLRKAGSDGWE